ncbi:MAG TPA: hypothetical protein VF580_13995 [Thermoanaerobaculia bacterium]
MRTSMTCPHLKEVVMLYCDACSFKKMVPLAHLASASPCLAQEFKSCLLYKDVLARLSSAITEEPAPVRPTPVFEREVSPS